MNPLTILALANRFAPIVGIIGLAVYHVAAKHDLASAVQDLEEAAAELGLPLGSLLNTTIAQDPAASPPSS